MKTIRINMSSELSLKDIVELRLKCLEPFIQTASKHSLDKKTIFELGENSWEYAVKPLIDINNQNNTPNAAVKKAKTAQKH